MSNDHFNKLGKVVTAGDSIYFVHTNYHWREFLCGEEVPQSVLDDYDWLDDDQRQYGWIKRYNEYMHISDFMRVDSSEVLPGWHGAHCTSAFSAFYIQLDDNGERYRIAYVHW